VAAVDKVQAGAALLDDLGPEQWWTKLDAANLEISSCVRCVLGQLYGTYSVGLDGVGISTNDARLYGFTAGDSDINERWREEIARRRLAAVPV